MYASKDATVRIEPGTVEQFKIEKGISQSYILFPCLFNFSLSIPHESMDTKFSGYYIEFFMLEL